MRPALALLLAAACASAPVTPAQAPLPSELDCSALAPPPEDLDRVRADGESVWLPVSVNAAYVCAQRVYAGCQRELAARPAQEPPWLAVGLAVAAGLAGGVWLGWQLAPGSQ